MEQKDFLNQTALRLFNIKYLFPYQRLVITNILEASGIEGFTPEKERNSVTNEWEKYDTRPHQIVILPTGAGKSLCFMLPASFLPGPTLVIYPLLSLIADQSRRLMERGFHPVILKGGQSKTERAKVWDSIEKNKTKFILSNPETLLQKSVLSRLKTINISHLVIDELHTVSEWGNTFRPSYLQVSRVHKETGVKVVTAFTATASPAILSRVTGILFPESSPSLIAANPDRPNIHYRILRSLSKTHDLVELIRGKDPSIIQNSTSYRVSRPVLIFHKSRTGAELTARHLRNTLKEKNIYFYHAGLSKKEKKKIETWFFHAKEGILSATCAYGMGVDKGDIRTVIHMDPPLSVEAYLQESGRAGRDKKSAQAILLLSEHDFIAGTLISNGNQKKRYMEFIRAVSDNTRCRRESLLRLLGTECRNCNGCDVCDGERQSSIAGLKEITAYVKKYNRKSSLRETILTLGGKKFLEVFANGYHRSKYYGSLKTWSFPEIKEGITALKCSGILQIPEHGFYKRKLIFKNILQSCYHPYLIHSSSSRHQKHSALFADKD